MPTGSPVLGNGMYRFLSKRENGKWPNGSRGVLSIEQFRALVLHECARCDRNSHQFSLIEMVVPDPGGMQLTGGQVRKILRCLSQLL